MNESITDALVECVKACGGSKVVGLAMWPTKGVEGAQRHMLAALNPERAEKLSPDELLHLLRMAREKGCHVGMSFMAHQAGYSEPQPVEPQDERAQLQREFIESTRALARMAQRIEALDRGPLRGVA
jgi:hypothetical protein